jgi:Flp pilus assembly protein TadG
MIIKLRQKSRGQVLVIFAVSSVAIFAIAALAIDGGRILMEQRRLQNALDGAALTGALDIGPGASVDQSGTGEDDAVYAIETSLGISFSNNYSVGHHLGTNPCAGIGCNGTDTSPTGPYNPINAATSPCCTNWVDTTGNYTLNIRTPYTYSGTTEPESYIAMDLTEKFRLLVAPGAWNANVKVSNIALNHAIPYSIFEFKHNDPADINGGNNNTLSTNKRIGVNGSITTAGGGGIGTNTITFTCTTPPTPANWGGDVWEYTVIASTTAITASSIGEGHCPSSTGTSTYKSLAGYVFPPNVHLPKDPTGCTSAGSCAALQGAVNVSGTQVLAPTRSSDPTQPWGPRYSAVNVSGAGNTLILEPGVYFFEGSAANSGLLVTSGGTVITGDCYLSTLPNCWTPGSGAPSICTAGNLALAVGGSRPFHCTSDYDFGVLLVFWPAGSDASSGVSCTNVNPTGSTNYYCTVSSSGAGANNQLQVQAGANLFISSSQKYHAVSLYVDPNNPLPSTTWNFTDPTKLSAAGCASNACALQIGIGSHVVYVQGGGSVSINGAILAPDDNSFLGGGGNGKGYGQILSYTASWVGNAAIKEAYNPIALAYTPVIVQ